MLIYVTQGNGKVVEFFQSVEVCICSIFPLWRWCCLSLLHCLLLFSLFELSLAKSIKSCVCWL